ncbi:MAG: zinc-binding dehydrogenase [Pseudomonadales bacterium]|nr:zinc-binding dehydrogenase [Pseudomonadales bacterium]
MHAIEVEGEGLIWREVSATPCGAGEVRIEIAATAINRADLIQRTGGYPPPPGASPIMGLECAGVVAEVGEGVTRVAVGDEVCALLSGGGYASETVVPAGQVLAIPKGLSLVEAAAIPEVFATAYLNLYMEAGIQVGERALVHAGASGVGTAASQMLKASGNPCFVTASGDDKIARCVELGADAGHDRSRGSFLAAVQAWTDQEGVDVVLDPVGGQYLADNLGSLRLNGRLVLIGLMGGAVAEINLGLLMMKRLRVVGSTLRARPIGEKAAVMDALKRDVWPNFEDGSVKPIIEEIIPIAKAEDAHALVAGNQTVGKVVMSVT